MEVNDKDTFLNNEVWVLTFGAAFQRANIYNKTATQAQKKKFKNELRFYIEKLVLEEYHKEGITDEAHINNINSIVNYTINYNKENDILSNGKLNFGVSQKLLNLYLKYKWCLKEIPTPSHFPVDRRIQSILKMKKIASWTQMGDSKEYEKIIAAVRDLAKTEELSAAHYELKYFQRSQNY